MDYPKLRKAFKDRFGHTPRLFRSPGRINVIGEHTDYNEGFVLPAGIDKEVCIAIAPNQTDNCQLYALDLSKAVAFPLAAYHQVHSGWAAYLVGVIDQLQAHGFIIGGFDCVFSGDVPIGAGLSSSAALECATLFALKTIYDLPLDNQTMVRLAQKAENEYVGVNCGIMDQFASMFAQEGHVLKLDCRDLSYQRYPLVTQEYQFVLVDSLVKHNLGDSEYNQRRSECEAGLAALKQQFPNIKALRDASIQELVAVRDAMEPVVYSRCKYIIEEIQRVNEACQALEQGNLERLGQLLYVAHQGMQYEFEISCPELDFLVDFTRPRAEVLGCRMMGGGFGGCTINLVKTDRMNDFSAAIGEAYEKAFGITPRFYHVNTAHGTSEVIG